jgi:hypothetical protein
LSTGGNAYNLTKIGAAQISLVSLTVDPALANLDIQSGTFAMEANCTSLGNPANTLTIRSGAMFQLFNTTNQVDKVIISEEGATIRNGAGVGTIIGPSIWPAMGASTRLTWRARRSPWVARSPAAGFSTKRPGAAR